jgi:hypothetical protein
MDKAQFGTDKHMGLLNPPLLSKIRCSKLFTKDLRLDPGKPTVEKQEIRGFANNEDARGKLVVHGKDVE